MTEKTAALERRPDHEAVQILVVEDDPQWNAALVRMYKSIFRPVGGAEVSSALDGTSARVLLQKKKFALLSCDINLSAGGKRGADADGRSVLRFAASNRRAGAVVVPTAAAFDAELRVAIPDRTEVQRMRLTSYLHELFDDRVLRLDKAEGVTPEDSTMEWGKAYADRIIALSEAWPSIHPPYTVRAEWPDDAVREAVARTGNSDEALRVTIWTTGKPEQKYSVDSRGGDSEFFLRLMMRYREGNPLADAEVVEIYGGRRDDPRQPEILVDTLSRRLVRVGLDPDRLFVRQRGRGWRFCADNTSEIVGHRVTDRHDADPVRSADRLQVQRELGVYIRPRGAGPDT